MFRGVFMAGVGAGTASFILEYLRIQDKKY